MITVWTACTGDAYAPDEVKILKRQVDRHLKEPHIFICLTEHEIEGITTIKPVHPLPGWWIKVRLFAPYTSHTRNLWLDLDVTISNPLDALVGPLRGSQLRIAKNWAQSGHGGCQSSVMYWEGDSAQIINDTFDPKDAHWPPRNDVFWGDQVAWGDQEWITSLRDTEQIEVEYFDPTQIVSYKYHCRDGLPPDSLVQVFHGRPNPADCSEAWIKEARG